MNGERNPEIRPNPELPLFEQKQYRGDGVLEVTEQAHARRGDPQTSHDSAASLASAGVWPLDG